MVAQEYRVRLESFEGPLDLLLFLIKRAEVDISEISIAAIADQYLEYLSQIDEVDVEYAGDFLVAAATVVEIKSRMVQRAADPEAKPAAERESGESRDDAATPGESLVQQLLAYRAVREAADGLDARHTEWSRRFPAGGAGVPEVAEHDDDEAVDLDDVALVDLIEAFKRIAETVQFDRVGDHRVEMDDTPIELHQADLLDFLGREDGGGVDAAGLPLRRVFEGRTKLQAIGLFLALLESIRQRKVQAFFVSASTEDDDRPAEVAIRLLDTVDDPEGDGPAASGWDDDHIFGDEDEDEDEDTVESS